MSEEISKGSIVVVESRTWPGSNKPGGVARVTAVHDADNDDGTANANTTTSPKKKKKRYDVSYVLGGKEKGVDEEYVTLQSSLSGGGDDDKKKRSSGGGGDLRISTSTASLALSAISSLETPKNVDIDEPTTNFPHPNPAIEERRKRKNSIQEDILLGHDGVGDDSRNSSYNSLLTGAAGTKQEKDEPLVKKIKIEAAADDAETSHDDEDDDSASSLLQNHHKTAIWSARKHLEIKDKSATTTTTTAAAAENDLPSTAVSSTSTASSLKRWRSHQIAEDYISLASALVLPPTTHLNTTSFGYVPHLGQYPIEQVTALGYLTSPSVDQP